ncbi:hypothetical protein M9Y10_013648 [Tritrichomonas musculus]|uniref:Leucine Rich Repeat family protein n=1 Tax=Tritrichomonas musculus TaxID=1915356 RepID=A0ABR2KXD3_9EUKA
MPSIYRFATHYALKNNLTVINKYLIKYSVTGSIGSSKAIFLLTESHFFLFEQNKNKLILMNPWKNIASISVDDLKLTLRFYPTNVDKFNINSAENNENKKYTIWSSQSDLKSSEIKTRIVALLQRVLSKTEKSALNLKNLSKANYSPTARSPMARFRMWNVLYDPSYKMDLPLYTELHKKIVYSLVFRDQGLQLNSFPQIEKILPVYLDILKVAPQVQQLRIPMIPSKKIYDNVINLLENNDYLKFLEISGNCQKDFFYMIKAIKDNKNSKISSLSFVNTQFTIEELTLIYSFITNGSNVNALGFHSSIKPEAVDYFYSSFLTPSLCEKLAILNLDKSPGINTEKLFPKITNITMLSLEGCDIELGDVFNCLAQGTAIGLKVLNISRCYVKNIPDIDLPQFNKNLQTLIINEVSWPSGTLVPFFQFLFSHFRKDPSDGQNEVNNYDLQNQSGPCLYFSNEIAETDEWLSLFEYLETVNDYGDLVTLAWNGNPVHQALFNFLLQNENLSTLMLSGCFSDESPDSIIDFCNFITSSISFSTLIVAGNDLNHFGKYTIDVINSLKNHQALKKLDISYNYGGDSVPPAILSLVENNLPLKLIDFDCVHCQNPSVIANLMRSLYQYRNRIQISFPTSEFTRLKNENILPRDQFDEITHMYKFPIQIEGSNKQPNTPPSDQFQDAIEIDENEQNNGDAQAKRKSDDDDDATPYIRPSQILTKEYCMFKNYNPPDFPCIIPKEQFEELRKQTKQQKAIILSPRRENETFVKSAITKRNSPRNNQNSNFEDEEEKLWPRSQKTIWEAKRNLRPSQKKEQYEKVQSPTSRSSTKPNNNKKLSKQNSRDLKKKGKKQTRQKVQEIDDYEEDFDYEYNDDYLDEKSPKLRSTKKHRSSAFDYNYNEEEEEDEIDDYGNNGKPYVRTPKKDYKYENFEFGTSQTVSLTESTGDDFIFEENNEPTKPTKSAAPKRKNPKKLSQSQSQKKIKNTKKKAKNPKKKRLTTPKIEENDEEYDDDQIISNNDSDNSFEEIKANNNRKINSKKPVKNSSIKGFKSKDKLLKSQPGKAKKQLDSSEKKNVNDNDNFIDDDDNEPINEIKNRNVPQPSYQFDDDDEEDVFNSQIFNDQMPKIDKYENSSNWQKYDQEFALNVLFTKIKYNKSV